MAPAKSKWEDEDSSTPPSSPPAPAVRRSKFEDEEDDSDVVEDWEGADDSEEEAEKAKAAVALKAKADAEAAAAKKSKTQRIAERQADKAKRRAEEEDETSSEESSEDEGEKRERLRATEQAADLRHAEDLFGDIGVPKSRSTPKGVIEGDPKNPGAMIDLAALPFFNPTTKDQFTKLRDTLAPVLVANSKKGQYALFLQEFCKQLAKEMPSEQVKKVASALTALSNEKMKEEKQADKGGKRSKAQKTKTTLAVGRNVATKADTTSYGDEGFDDDDFM